MTLKRKIVPILILLASTQAFGFAVVLTTDMSKLKIEMAELDKDHVLVAWEKLPGAHPAGAMVYRKNELHSETDYFAVGGGGLFAIIDHGGRHRSFSVVADDPEHPEHMFVADREVDIADLKAKYDAYENVGTAAETKPVIEAQLTAKAADTDKACGSHIVPQIHWAGFTKASKINLAKQAIGVLEALEATCADKDYRAVVKAMTSMTVDFTPGSELQLTHTNAALSVVFGETNYNPRESAAQLLKKQL